MAIAIVDQGFRREAGVVDPSENGFPAGRNRNKCGRSAEFPSHPKEKAAGNRGCRAKGGRVSRIYSKPSAYFSAEHTARRRFRQAEYYLPEIRQSRLFPTQTAPFLSLSPRKRGCCFRAAPCREANNEDRRIIRILSYKPPFRRCVFEIMHLSADSQRL